MVNAERGTPRYKASLRKVKVTTTIPVKRREFVIFNRFTFTESVADDTLVA